MRAHIPIAAAVWLAPTLAIAGGVALPVRGVRALSVGGAFVAGADGGNALWYNPARMDATSFTLEVGAVALDATYTAPGAASVSNDASPLPNPTLAAVWRVSDLLSVGIGAFAPYSGQHGFDPQGAQRYSLVASADTTQLYVSAGFALRFNRLRVGASIQNVVSHIRQRTVLSGYTGLFGTPDDPELDILNEIDLQDPITFTGNLGASFDAGPFTIGVAAQLPYTVSGQAKYLVRLGDSAFFDPIVVEGDTVAFSVPFPFSIRGGVEWRIFEDWKVEGAMTYELWSVQDQLVLDPEGRIRLRDVPGIGDYEVGPIVVERRMKDTYSLHLGTDYQIIEGLHLRGGLFYEPSAFPEETFTVAQLDGDKFGVALGASYQLGVVRFDLAASRVFQGTRNITRSVMRQVNPTNPDQGIVVGNGRYESGLWTGGLGVTVVL